MRKPDKNSDKKVVTTNKKIPVTKTDNDKNPQVDKNYRPQGSDEQIGDGSAGMGGTSAI